VSCRVVAVGQRRGVSAVARELSDVRNLAPLGREVLRLRGHRCVYGSGSSSRSFRSALLPTHRSALTGTPLSRRASGSFRLRRFTGIERRAGGDCSAAGCDDVVGEIDESTASRFGQRDELVGGDLL
jgi:hypothetical protein